MRLILDDLLKSLDRERVTTCMGRNGDLASINMSIAPVRSLLPNEHEAITIQCADELPRRKRSELPIINRHN